MNFRKLTFSSFQTAKILQYLSKDMIYEDDRWQQALYIDSFTFRYDRNKDVSELIYYENSHNTFNYEILNSYSLDEKIIERFFLLIGFTHFLPISIHSGINNVNEMDKLIRRLENILLIKLVDFKKNFYIEKKIAEGAYGKIYLGIFNLLSTEPLSLYFKNLIKGDRLPVIKWYQSDVKKERFEDYCIQYQKIKQLTCNSENVIQVYFGIKVENNYVMGMEELDGTLFQCAPEFVENIRGHEILTKYEYVKMFVDLMKVLKCLHGYNMYHNDIKPENIGIRKNGSMHHALLFDFDLSCGGFGDVCSKSGYTPVFISPERIFKSLGYRNYQGKSLQQKAIFTNRELCELDDSWALALSFYFSSKKIHIEDLMFNQVEIYMKYINYNELPINYDEYHGKFPELNGFFTLILNMLNLHLEERKRIECLDLKDYGLDNIEYLKPSSINFL